PAAAAVVAVVAADGIVLLPLIVAALWLWPGKGRAERRRIALTASLSIVLAGVLVAILAPAFDRPRPFVALGIAPLFPHDADSSFPSDHALVGMALAWPLLWKARRVGVWAVACALAVGLARVAAAVHYPTDILGSALIALLPAAAALALTPVLEG